MNDPVLLTEMPDDPFLIPLPGTEREADFLSHAVIEASADGDFFDKAEETLLSALILLAAEHCPEDRKTLGDVYKMILENNETTFDHMFRGPAPEDPARQRYFLFRNALQNGGGVMLGLTFHLKAFRALYGKEAEDGKEE